ncbi:MAG: biotin/lipoyl-binding protein [Candidatus Heimdallarchaeota archaeon]|nr:biotin/lipoyl-binding protein [Candidatus Heimdallarchaeota archaeon]
MVYELKFADIGEGVHEGEILEWHVAIGDVVKVEQLLLEVNTEKVNAEITSPVSGTVDSLEFDVGDIVKVGQVLIKIDEGNGKLAETKKPQPKKDVEAEKDDSLFTPAAPFQRITQITKVANVVNERVLAPTEVRRRAREANVDLKTLVGSGP